MTYFCNALCFTNDYNNEKDNTLYTDVSIWSGYDDGTEARPD